MRKGMRTFGLLGAVALLAGGCGGDDDDGAGAAEPATVATTAAEPVTEATSAAEPATAAASAAEEPDQGGGDVGECTEQQAGGELTFGVMVEMPGFDPVVGGSTGPQGGHERAAVFDTLMQYDTETGEYSPRLAESLEPNDDLTEWTLTLRDGVTFGNGEPVDTGAVEFTVDRHRAQDSQSINKGIASLIESMAILDERTMVFHLNSPWGNFPSLLAGPVGMVIDPGTFEQLGPQQFAADPQGGGAGPYRVARYAPGEEIVLEAKDDYWDGPVCIKTLRFVFVPGDDPRYETFRNGELDVAFLRSAPTLAQAREDGVNLQTEVVNGGNMVIINNGARGTDRPGKDVRVRQAIAYALDPEVLLQRATGGAGVPSTALVSETSLLHLAGGEGPGYDPDKAQALLEEVKAETGYDGSLRLVCSNNPEFIERGIVIEAMLEAVGFQVALKNDLDSVGAHLAETADYDIACLSLGMTDGQPWEGLARSLSGGDSPRSIMGYVSPEMDAVLQALKEAATLEERQEALVEVQRLWNETVPSAITDHVEQGPIWADRVEGLELTMNAVVLFDEARVTG